MPRPAKQSKHSLLILNDWRSMFLTTLSLADLHGAIEESETLAKSNKDRWPAHSLHGTGNGTSLWSLAPEDVAKEQNMQMIHD